MVPTAGLASPVRFDALRLDIAASRHGARTDTASFTKRNADFYNMQDV
jgi:hypothetical protein